MAFPLSIIKQGRNILCIYNNIRRNIDKSQVNSSETNNLNTSNSSNFIVNLNPPCINVQTKSSFNILITLQKETDTESSISANDKIMDETI